MGMRAANDLDATKASTAGAQSIIDPGWYHVEVIGVEEKDVESDKPYTVFELEVRAGTVPAMVNKTIRDRRYWYNTNEMAQRLSQEAICLYAVQTGVCTKDELDEMIQSGDLNFDWGKAQGAHLIVEYEHRVVKDKIYHGVKNGQVYQLDDPRVEDKPKDARAAQTRQAAEVF